jgi:hypothetical protein
MLEQLGSLSQILATLGVSAAAMAAVRRYLENRRWDNYKRRVVEWTDDMLAVGIRIDKSLDDGEWRSECESMLSDVGFTPLEIHQVLEVSLVVAKGIASTRFLS